MKNQLFVYMQITIEAPAAWEEAFTMFLFAQGAEGVEVDDPQLIADHLARGDWDASVFDGQEITVGLVSLRTLLPYEIDLPAFEQALQAFTAGQEVDYRYQAEPLPAQDWQRVWREQFPSLHLGERISIEPYWRAEQPLATDAVRVLVSPGMAFGTGDHATTALAARLLEQSVSPGAALLDLGTGSGILAILARRLGAGRLLATDIDEVCRESVDEHRRLNGLTERDLPLLIGDVISDPAVQQACREFQADLLVSNIVAGVLMELAPLVADFLKPGGVWLLSGVLEDKEPALLQVLEREGWQIEERYQEGEWLAFRCRREECDA